MNMIYVVPALSKSARFRKFRGEGHVSWNPILTDFFIFFDNAIQLSALIIITYVQVRNVVRMTIC